MSPLAVLMVSFSPLASRSVASPLIVSSTICDSPHLQVAAHRLNGYRLHLLRRLDNQLQIFVAVHADQESDPQELLALAAIFLPRKIPVAGDALLQIFRLLLALRQVNVQLAIPRRQDLDVHREQAQLDLLDAAVALLRLFDGGKLVDFVGF